jgi:hypothetical protein
LLRRLRQEDCEFEVNLGKVSENISQKPNRKQKKGWRCGSSGRVLAQHDQGPGFNTSKKGRNIFKIYLSTFLYV